MYDEMYIDPYSELYHHGIKGQKWGVRRYQNSDGSLTDEGRRRYGFGSGKGLITQNTKDRAKQGLKLGAKIGAGVGVGATAVGVGMLAATGVPVTAAAALTMGATYISAFTASGAVDGLRYGAIAGAIETSIGRNYIKKNDKGLKDFETRELRKTK